MLQLLKDFLNEVGVGDKPADRFDRNDDRLAAAALLIHVMTVDGKETGEERDKLHELLKRQFNLDDDADRRTDRGGDRGRSRIRRSLSFHQSARSLARRGWPPPHREDDVGDGLCRWPPERVRGQHRVARLRPARHFDARSRRIAPRGRRRMPARRRTMPDCRPLPGFGSAMIERRPVTIITGASSGIGARTGAGVRAQRSSTGAGGAPREPARRALADEIASAGQSASAGAGDRSRTARCRRSYRRGACRERSRTAIRGQQCRLRSGRRASNPATGPSSFR